MINKVTHGDTMERIKEIQARSVDLIVTDPPYGMDFQSQRRKEIYDKIKGDVDLGWLDSFMAESFRILKENSHAYFFCSFHKVDQFKLAIEKHFKIKNILIWKKNNHGSGDLNGAYAPQYEMIIFCHKGRRFLNKGRQSDILEFNKTGNKLHPTEKPIDLIKYLIEKSSNEGEIVFDGFMGSWTTAVGCKELGRNFIGFEISKEYCNVGRKRLGMDILNICEEDAIEDIEKPIISPPESNNSVRNLLGTPSSHIVQEASKPERGETSSRRIMR